APTPPTNNAGVLTYYVSQTVNGCESARDSIIVTIYAKPQPPWGSDDTTCQFAPPVLLGAVGINLRWYDVPTGGTPSFTPPLAQTDTAGIFYWYVSQQINGCESDRDTVGLVINPQPAPPEGDSAEFCLNG